MYVRVCVCVSVMWLFMICVRVHASVVCVDAGLATVTPFTVAVVFTIKTIVHNAAVWSIIRKV